MLAGSSLSEEEKRALGRSLASGDNHYRAYIGSPEIYDVLAARHFWLLTTFGLREEHYLLDIGCGSLRVGKLLIVYLLKGRYFGIEPNEWLVRKGIQHELGDEIIRLKEPTFAFVDDFSFSRFKRQFDFVFAHSIFSHAHLQQIDKCLAEVALSTHSNSFFLATYNKGSSDYRGNTWVYPGQSTFRPETICKLAEKHGLVAQELLVDTLIGQTWMAFSSIDNKEELVKRAADCAQQSDARFWAERYHRLRSHPWVRIGMSLRRLLGLNL